MPHQGSKLGQHLQSPETAQIICGTEWLGALCYEAGESRRCSHVASLKCLSRVPSSPHMQRHESLHSHYSLERRH